MDTERESPILPVPTERSDQVEDKYGLLDVTLDEGKETEAGEHDSTAKYKAAAARLDRRLFWVVSILLVVVTTLFVFGLVVQWNNYHAGIKTALEPPSIDHGAALSYARGLDADFVKTSALFLGFLLVFTGTLYVLRSAAAAYQLSVKGGTYGGSLGTSSPGLVIISLGVLLIAITILSRSELNYAPPSPSAAQPAQVNQKAFEPPPDLEMTDPPATDIPAERKK